MRLSHTTNPDSLAYYLDGVNITGAEIQLSGWAISTKGPVSFRVFQGAKEVEITVNRTHLLDISRAVLKNDSQPDAGFRIKFKNQGADFYTLVLTDGVNTHKQKADARGKFKKRTLRPRAAEDYAKTLTQVPNALKEEGFTRFSKEFFGDILSDDTRYTRWFKKRKPTEEVLRKERETRFEIAPKISLVVPIYKTPEKFLREMIDSCVAQTYENWELVCADGSGSDLLPEKVIKEYAEKDPRVIYKRLDKNGGISYNTNEAVKAATGEFIGLMDHDDLLEPSLLFRCVKAINEDPEITAVYTDEGKISMDGRLHFRPVFKPDFDLTYLLSGNYICHFFMVRSDVVEKVGLFDEACDGAQDLDFILRCTEEGKTCHIPEILYHWRSHPNSTADDPQSKMYCYEAGNRAVRKHYERAGIPATSYVCSVYGHYATVFRETDAPKVSVVIHGSDDEALIKRTKESVTRYAGAASLQFMEGFAGLKEATGDYLFFISAGTVLKELDTSLFEKSLLPENFGAKLFPGNLVGRLQDPTVAAVSVKVLDVNGQFVYGGAYRNEKHGFDVFPRRVYGNSTEFGGKFLDAKETAMVSKHGFMIRRDLFERLSIDFEKLPNLWDAELSLHLTDMGLKMIYEPFVSVQTDFSEPKKPMHLLYKEETETLVSENAHILGKPDSALNPNRMIHLGRWVLKD